MKYTVIKNSKYTGVTYDELNDKIIAHHTAQGEMIAPVEIPPQPIDIVDDMPVYGEVSLNNIKKGKILMLNLAFEAELAKGYETSYGIKLAATPTDYQFYAVGKERAKRKIEKGEQNPTIARMKDWYGKLHKDIPASDYIAMIEELEEYLENLWYHKVDLEEKVWAATTAEEVEAVKW